MYQRKLVMDESIEDIIPGNGRYSNKSSLMGNGVDRLKPLYHFGQIPNQNIYYGLISDIAWYIYIYIYMRPLISRIW